MADIMTIPVGGTSVKLIDDDRICQHLKAGKTFEPTTLQTWDTIMRAGSIGWVIDVGAYSGLFSIAAAKNGHQVLAIEPLVELQARIADNARINYVQNHVVIIPAAATHFSGEIAIGVNEKVHLTSGASVLRKSNQRIVPAWRLDDFDPGELRVVAIKIDVERHEVGVIEGGLALIEKHEPVIVVECLDGEARSNVEGLLRRFDYETVTQMDERNYLLRA